VKQEKILVLGREGTNGHQVALKLMKSLKLISDLKIEFCKSNPDILKSVYEGKASFGVVPVENSTTGRISPVVNFWVSLPPDYRNLFVVGGTDLPVKHCLLVHPKITQAKQLKIVCSHSEALGQCQGSLQKFKLENRFVESTADAAKIVAETNPLEGLCAIASELSARIYGLKIWRKNFQDEDYNSTRFHLVGRKKIGQPSGRDLTPLIFWLENAPGTLCDALWVFKKADINMSSIHSIPLGKGKYSFYVEISGH
jgi:prephenate dehydratase